MLWDGHALTRSTLRDGAAIMLDAKVEVRPHFEFASTAFEGLTADRAWAISTTNLCSFTNPGKVREPQRQLLGAHAIILSRVQNRMPSRGVVYHGPMPPWRRSCSPARSPPRSVARHRKYGSEAVRRRNSSLMTIAGYANSAKRCRAQAIKEDNLSLLRGLGTRGSRLSRGGEFSR